MLKRTIIVLLLCAFLCVFVGCYKVVSKEAPQDMDLENYVESIECVVKYGLDVFPSDVDEDAIDDYYFMKNSTLMDDTIVIYAKCKYDVEELENEVERLSRIKYGVFDADERFMRKEINYSSEVRFDETNFNYPAYVTVWLKGTCCSYALVDEPNQEIIYVYLQYANRAQVEFDKNYLPKDSGEKISIGNLSGDLP